MKTRVMYCLLCCCFIPLIYFDGVLLKSSASAHTVSLPDVLTGNEMLRVEGLRGSSFVVAYFVGSSGKRVGMVVFKLRDKKVGVGMGGRIRWDRIQKSLVATQPVKIFVHFINQNKYEFFLADDNNNVLHEKHSLDFAGIPSKVVLRPRTIGDRPTLQKNLTSFTGLPELCGTKQTSRTVGDNLCRSHIGTQQRIVGGFPSLAGAHPWQVAILEVLGETQRHICGGALVSECAAISAGHCFPYTLSTRYRVRVGDYYNKDDPTGKFNLYENPETFGVAKVILHEGYNSYPVPINDIAIVALAKKSNGRCATFGNYVQPICLPTLQTSVANRQSCHITGWGANHFQQDPRDYAACLQVASVLIQNSQECQNQYKDIYRSELMFCAKGQGGADTCQGDSGGPLVCSDQSSNKVLWGITSFGDRCGGAKAGVYTKVANYIPWITEKFIKTEEVKTSSVTDAMHFT